MADLLKLQAKLANKVKNKLGTQLKLFIVDVTPPGFTAPVSPKWEVSEIDVLESRYKPKFRETLDRLSIGQDTGMWRVLVPRIKKYNYGLFPPGTWILKSKHWDEPVRCAVVHQSLEDTDNAYGTGEVEVLLATLKDEPTTLTAWVP